MLVAMAIGDIYGFPFRYKNIDFHKNNTGKKYCGKSFRYNCFTQQAVAIAQLLVEKVEFTEMSIATRFISLYSKDPRAGYPNLILDNLRNSSTGKELLSHNNQVNGVLGAVRAIPMGMLPLEEIRDRTILQCCVTHYATTAVDAALAVAYMSYFFLRSGHKKCHLSGFLDSYVPGYSWSIPFRSPVVGPEPIDIVKTVVTELNSCENLHDLLVSCCGKLGATDAITSLAMGCGFVSSDMVRNLSPNLLEDMDVKDREELQDLDHKIGV